MNVSMWPDGYGLQFLQSVEGGKASEGSLTPLPKHFKILLTNERVLSRCKTMHLI